LAAAAHNDAARCAIAAADAETRSITAAKTIVLAMQAGLAQQRWLAEVSRGAARAPVVIYHDVVPHLDVVADAYRSKNLGILTAEESLRAAASAFAAALGFAEARVRNGHTEFIAANRSNDKVKSAIKMYELAECWVRKTFQRVVKTHAAACREVTQVMSVLMDLADPKQQEAETVATGRPNAMAMSGAAAATTPRGIERLFAKARLASQELASAEAHAAVTAYQVADAFAAAAACYWMSVGEEHGGPSQVYEDMSEVYSSDSSVEYESEEDESEEYESDEYESEQENEELIRAVHAQR
jgi:hypothetical protein